MFERTDKRRQFNHFFIFSGDLVLRVVLVQLTFQVGTESMVVVVVHLGQLVVVVCLAPLELVMHWHLGDFHLSNFGLKNE